MAGRRLLGSVGCLGLVAALGGSGTGFRAAPRPVIEVVEVRVDDGSLAAVIATGWVGPCGLVVTVAHALDGQRGVVVVPSGDRPHQAQIVARDDGPDLALLRVEGLRTPTLSLADMSHSPLRVAVRRDQRRVALLGVQSPRPVSITIDDRRGTHVREGLEWAPGLVAGDSGAPVLDDQGRVVGIAFATSNSLAYATAASELRALIARDLPGCLDGHRVVNGQSG
jgi:S1-C subfamily serine protease